ncbi:5'-nucleotidase C-terminal domain-containing protein [Sinomicrobium weinanense]|uniref:5'-nucleotidase C-terminal domain-containing protein n=1 Tax=Sinomicrobium weinanense TaxID=2842200 RepID=A0A926JPZ8_9FLAO|nr:5'-nucleotidase [Sinomicrobium weinanense]MBC9795330.1 5'-nucleotidase C-terminal domain-containing protein [Sinomicrobium weinanense]MBU3122955.1 5'-nucleotidase C-terminal domain-containing protein [Sinomicrobium weinanense]
MHKNILKPDLKYIKITHFVIFTTIIVFFSCKNESSDFSGNISRIEGREININDSIAADQSIDDFVRPYREHIDKDLSTPLAYNPETLNKTDGELNTAIGNLMADIVMEQSAPVFRSRKESEIDAVLLNFGGIRAMMPKGDVTARTAYEVMPFENAIVVLELSGKKVREMIDYLVKRKTAHPISGIKLSLNSNGGLKEALIGGKQIEDGKNYFIATSDYLMNGGDNMNFFLNPVSVTPLDYRIRNAMIDYFTRTDTIQAVRDDRFVME